MLALGAILNKLAATGGLLAGLTQRVKVFRMQPARKEVVLTS